MSRQSRTNSSQTPEAGGLSNERRETSAFLALQADDLPELSTEMNALDVYMARLRNMEPLSSEEQEELARRYKEEGDELAGQILVATNLRLVVKLAMDYNRDRDELLELVQEGNIGISKALDRFDQSKNVKFTSYAQYWVRARILDYLINRGRLVRLGTSRAGRKLFYNYKKAKEALEDQGHEPTVTRIADYLDVDEDDVMRVGNQLDEAPVSLDEEVSADSSTTLRDLVKADVDGPDELVADHELWNRVREAIDAFGEQLEDERERAIWYERTTAEDPKYLRELGDDWGVSKERIRQIEAELISEFRSFFTKRLGGRKQVEYALSA